MRAGDLRHRVTIETPAYFESAVSGEKTITWQSPGQKWAAIRPVSAREIVQYAQTKMQVSHVITMRYTPDIKPDSRLIFDGRIYNISSILNTDELSNELRILANEVK